MEVDFTMFVDFSGICATVSDSTRDVKAPLVSG